MQGQSGADMQSMRTFLNNSKEVVCENCGGKFFKQSFIMRTVSPILTASKEAEYVPMMVFRCDDCGAPIADMLPPDDIKEEPKVKILQ